MSGRLTALAVMLGVALAVPAAAESYLHADVCLNGLAGANGDNEIAASYPHGYWGVWTIDDLVVSRAGDDHVVWSWRWKDGYFGGAMWRDGECIGSDSSYIDRLIYPG